MARRQRLAAANGTAGGAVARRKAPALDQLWLALTRDRKRVRHFRPHETAFFLRNLSTLVGNGVPLPKALATLSREESLAKHRSVLDGVRRKVESGAPFSSAIAECPGIGDKITVSQIKIGERSGTLADTLQHLAENRDKSRELRQQVIKKLAYPGMLMVLGSGVIMFLLLYVIPVFEQTYKDAGVPLPLVTQLLIAMGGFAQSYLLLILGAGALAAFALAQVRKNEQIASRMDRGVLRAPMFGRWLRDIAVLQVMDVLDNLLAAGFTLNEALRQTADSVSNRAVRGGVKRLQAAVERGERFSREIERLEDLFPPIVNQLVIVGENTGQLPRAAHDICDHLRREIERKTSLLVGALEPILTISLASAIAVILLAIYLPMFDMVNTVSH